MTIEEEVKRLRDKNAWFTEAMSENMENALWKVSGDRENAKEKEEDQR